MHSYSGRRDLNAQISTSQKLRDSHISLRPVSGSEEVESSAFLLLARFSRALIPVDATTHTLPIGDDPISEP